MGTREAIEAAIKALKSDPRGLAYDPAVVETLQMIVDQRGCEDFDAAVTDGQLTTLMDVVIFG